MTLSLLQTKGGVKSKSSLIKSFLHCPMNRLPVTAFQFTPNEAFLKKGSLMSKQRLVDFRHCPVVRPCVLACVFSLGRPKRCSATIMQNGEIITTVTLDHHETLTIPGTLGTSTIEIAPNQIRMLEAPCPDHTCVKTGWIHHSGQVIACVPNRIVIRIPRQHSTGERYRLLIQDIHN